LKRAADLGERRRGEADAANQSKGSGLLNPVAFYRGDGLRARLAVLLDISRAVLRMAAPVVDLLVRLSLAKAFFAPGLPPGSDVGESGHLYPSRRSPAS